MPVAALRAETTEAARSKHAGRGSPAEATRRPQAGGDVGQVGDPAVTSG
ncbi:hypothetical protein [Actinoplanes sp. DH11]|nr:hypothetical protein [Actinoplanes sp. DH11]